jgi:hypothetical protein
MLDKHEVPGSIPGRPTTTEPYNVVLTRLQTADMRAWYRVLPSRVPIHFGTNGKADSFGPRPLLWATVGAQLIFAALYQPYT